MDNLRPRSCVPTTSIARPAIVESAVRATGPNSPWSIEYFRKKPTPTTRINTPMRNSHRLAIAYSIDTPCGTCSSPTMIQFQIRWSVSLAAVSSRLGSRGGAGLTSGQVNGSASRAAGAKEAAAVAVDAAIGSLAAVTIGSRLISTGCSAVCFAVASVGRCSCVICDCKRLMCACERFESFLLIALQLPQPEEGADGQKQKQRRAAKHEQTHDDCVHGRSPRAPGSGAGKGTLAPRVKSVPPVSRISPLIEKR